MAKGIEALEAQVAVASSKGNYDCDPYMWGMANGLICALATMRDETPVYLDKPTEWPRDRPQDRFEATSDDAVS